MDSPARIVLAEDDSITALYLAKQLRSAALGIRSLRWPAVALVRLSMPSLAVRTSCSWTFI
jgi:hypothetical protein